MCNTVKVKGKGHINIFRNRKYVCMTSCETCFPCCYKPKTKSIPFNLQHYVFYIMLGCSNSVFVVRGMINVRKYVKRTINLFILTLSIAN